MKPAVSTAGSFYGTISYVYLCQPKTIKMSEITIYNLIGKRVRMIEMFDDPFPIKPGTEGTVLSVGADVITVKWDDGRQLGMIWDVDQYEIID